MSRKQSLILMLCALPVLGALYWLRTANWDSTKKSAGSQNNSSKAAVSLDVKSEQKASPKIVSIEAPAKLPGIENGSTSSSTVKEQAIRQRSSLNSLTTTEVISSADNTRKRRLPRTANSSGTAMAAAEMISTSWQDPFQEEFWNSRGWIFEKSKMTSDGSPDASAEFRRSYLKLMLECDLIPLSETVGELRLVITTKDLKFDETDAVILPPTMTLVINQNQMQVLATVRGKTSTIKKQVFQSPLVGGTSQSFRVVATGNRMVVSWNGKKFLTADQISSQSGHAVLWSIQASDLFEISKLRIEGD